jgi:hypothetical protein
MRRCARDQVASAGVNFRGNCAPRGSTRGAGARSDAPDDIRVFLLRERAACRGTDTRAARGRPESRDARGPLRLRGSGRRARRVPACRRLMADSSLAIAAPSSSCMMTPRSPRRLPTMPTRYCRQIFQHHHVRVGAAFESNQHDCSLFRYVGLRVRWPWDDRLRAFRWQAGEHRRPRPLLGISLDILAPAKIRLDRKSASRRAGPVCRSARSRLHDRRQRPWRRTAWR